MTNQTRNPNDQESPHIEGIGFFGIRHSEFFRHSSFVICYSSAAFLLTIVVLTAGCRTYQYRVVQPPQSNGLVAEQPVMVHYDPLEYTFARVRDRLALRISNPTTNQVVLRGDRSFVIDPRGESHPVPGTVIGAHSYARMFLPPLPATAEVVGYYGYPLAWGAGFYGYRDPRWNGFVYGPSVTYFQLNTPFDWVWKTGPVQLHLAFDGTGPPFEHHFEIIRERSQ